MKVRNARTGEYVVIHKELDEKNKKAVFELLGLKEIYKNKKSRAVFWDWYCKYPGDEIFIRTGYELRLSITPILIPKSEYIATVPTKRGDK